MCVSVCVCVLNMMTPEMFDLCRVYLRTHYLRTGSACFVRVSSATQRRYCRYCRATAFFFSLACSILSPLCRSPLHCTCNAPPHHGGILCKISNSKPRLEDTRFSFYFFLSAWLCLHRSTRQGRVYLVFIAKALFLLLLLICLKGKKKTKKNKQFGSADTDLLLWLSWQKIRKKNKTRK